MIHPRIIHSCKMLLAFGILPFTGFGIGALLDRHETERMTRFRDKSALYGRVLQPGEKPSWP